MSDENTPKHPTAKATAHEDDSRQHSFGNDNLTAPQPEADPSLGADIIMGLRFFSRLPTGASNHQVPSLTRMVPALGLVSLIIGIGPATALIMLFWLGLPALVAACLAVALQILATGAMAEDALADSMDGFWGGHDVERRLEIMKDSRLGTYGVLALILLIASRLAVLSALLISAGIGAALLWMGAQILARQLALWLPVRLSRIRRDGVAHSVGDLPGRSFGLGLLFGLPLFFILAGLFTGISGVVVSCIVASAIVFGWTRLCHNKVAGYSGDMIGGLQALIEIGVLCVLILFA